MKTKYIAKNIIVDLDDSVEIADNGLYGDLRIVIMQEQATGNCWLETNGDPIVCETLEDAYDLFERLSAEIGNNNDSQHTT